METAQERFVRAGEIARRLAESDIDPKAKAALVELAELVGAEIEANTDFTRE